MSSPSFIHYPSHLLYCPPSRRHQRFSPKTHGCRPHCSCTTLKASSPHFPLLAFIPFNWNLSGGNTNPRTALRISTLWDPSVSSCGSFKRQPPQPFDRDQVCSLSLRITEATKTYISHPPINKRRFLSDIDLGNLHTRKRAIRKEEAFLAIARRESFAWGDHIQIIFSHQPPCTRTRREWCFAAWHQLERFSCSWGNFHLRSWTFFLLTKDTVRVTLSYSHSSLASWLAAPDVPSGGHPPSSFSLASRDLGPPMRDLQSLHQPVYSPSKTILSSVSVSPAICRHPPSS